MKPRNSFRNFVFAGSALLTVTYTQAQATRQWNNNGTSNIPWLTTTNWSPSGTFAGGAPLANPTGEGANNDIMGFVTANTGTTAGINMNTLAAGGGVGLILGGIDLTRTSANAFQIGNSSSTVSGIVQLNGATINTVANTLIRVNSGNMTITNVATGATDGGQTLGLRLGITNGIFDVSASRALTIASIISESAASSGFTKTGTGSLTLSGANTFTGAINLSAGTLILNNATALGGSTPGTNGASSLSMGANTALQSNFAPADLGISDSFVYAPITLTAAGTNSFLVGAGSSSAPAESVRLNLNGAIGGSAGANVVFGNTTASRNNADSIIVLGAASTYNGNTTIQAGNAQNRINVVSGVANALPVTTVLGFDSATGITSGRNTQFDLNGNNQTLAGLDNGGTVPELRTIRVTNSSGTAATLTINNAGDFTFGGSTVSTTLATLGLTSRAQIQGNLNLVKNGTGTFTLGGTLAGGATAGGHTFTGSTTVLGGILVLGESIAIQNSALDTTASITGDATNGLRTATTTQTFGGLTGNKNLADVFTSTTGGYTGLTALTLNPGTGVTNIYSGDVGNGDGSMSLTKSGAGTQTLNAAQSYSGATNVSGGVLNVNAALTSATYSLGGGSLAIGASALLPTSSAVTLSGGTLAMGAFDNTVASVSLQSGSITGTGGTLTSTSAFDLRSGSASAILGGSVGLDKTTSGTVTLTGNNTYTGLTTITAGTLQLGDGTTGNDGTIASTSGVTNDGTLTFNRFGTSTAAYDISGSGAVTKLGAGTQILTGNNSYSGLTTIGAGTLQLGVNNGISTASGIDIGSGAPTTATLDLNGFDQTLPTLVFTTQNAGGNLTVTGGTNSKLTINATSNTELGAGGAINGVRDVTVDMSGLGELDWNGAANTFRVGLRSGASNSAGPGAFTTNLADKNTITALALSVGDVAASNNGGTSILRLGQTNFLNADTINLGNGSRNNATLEFRSGLTNPKVTIRGTNGTASVGTWEVGAVNHFSNVVWTALADFSAGELDANVTNLRIGVANTGASTGRAGTENATFTMGKGTLNVTSLIIGQYNGTNAGTVTNTYRGNGIFNLNDAAGVVTADSIILADNIGLAGGGGTRTTSGTLNLNAGTLQAKSIGKGADTGNANSTTRILNFSGGTLKNQAGFDLTITDVPIALTGSGTRVFEATAGQKITVASTSPIGEDVAGNGLTKSGTGTLILGSTSTYTGGTLVSAGTLLVTGSLTSDVTVSDLATVGGGGAVGSISFGGDSFFDIFAAVNGLDSLASATISFAAAGFGIDNLVSQGLPVNWGSISNGTYTLITGTLTETNLGNLGSTNPYDIGGGRTAYFENGSLNLVVIPEPSTALLGALGALMLLRRRR